MNLLEPWVMLRLSAGLVAVLLFARAATTALKVLRHFDVRRATEGQLALERQVELSSTFVRVATIVQVASLGLTALSAERLSRGIRGAMCGYGVFRAHELGFTALFVTAAVALAAGVASQLYAFDARVRGLDLVRPLAWSTLFLAPLAAVDLFVTARFLLGLDLTVAASCCSVELDASDAALGGYVDGPRVAFTIAALVFVPLSALVAWLASRRPKAPVVTFAGALAIFAAPVALGATVFEVAPHAFEVPQHVCPFCLLKPDVLGLGYPLFGAVFLAAVWGAGAALAALVSRGEAARAAFGAFASSRLRRGAGAWLLALALGAAPVVRYVLLSNGASLFD
jgi:hypothetical protein